jgi:hypothetical protein
LSLYAFPRVGQAGLGNTLFPWARAELFASDSGAQLLAPRWGRLRLGPYLRREPEKRRYSGFFHSATHVRGWARAWIRASGRHFSESEGEVARKLAAESARACVVDFEGLAGLFDSLATRAPLLRERLWAMTDPDLRSTGLPAERPFVAMHVRRGDLTRQGFTPEQLLGVLQYTPLSWFQSMVNASERLPEFSGFPILVFTDGSGEEIDPLLSMRGVSRSPRQAAIADLWMMSRSSLLFASGYSTFGMWASFLGGMPTIYAPGKIQQLVQRDREGSREVELPEGAEIPRDVAAAVRFRAGL